MSDFFTDFSILLTLHGDVTRNMKHVLGLTMSFHLYFIFMSLDLQYTGAKFPLIVYLFILLWQTMLILALNNIFVVHIYRH